jgi:ribonuclease R
VAWRSGGLALQYKNERRADENQPRWKRGWCGHLGEEFGGVVTAATGFGLFVTVAPCMWKVEEFHITELGGIFVLTKHARKLRGEITGIRYAIGTVFAFRSGGFGRPQRSISFWSTKSDLQALTGTMKTKWVTSGNFAVMRHSGVPAPETKQQQSAGQQRKSELTLPASAGINRSAHAAPVPYNERTVRLFSSFSCLRSR